MEKASQILFSVVNGARSGSLIEVISDNEAIREYVKNEYGLESFVLRMVVTTLFANKVNQFLKRVIIFSRGPSGA